ncbi:MAG: FAD-binding protein [Clostridiales bacterium]|nr:FAD-binding protein [Clostridiales bacterium]
MDSTQKAAYPWLQEPDPITEIVSEESCDIVVIGAGIAGCTAAEAASSAGAFVIVCDKYSSSTPQGIDIGAVGSKV